MTNSGNFLNLRTEADKRVYAIEALIFSVQMCVQKAMQDKGVSAAELANELGISERQMKNILGSYGHGVTINLLGRICHFLGEEFVLVSRNELNAKAPEKWRPIETAPKDEDSILLIHRHTGGGNPAVAFWDGQGWMTNEGAIRYPEKFFTNWMQIPDLPEDAP